MLRVLFAVLAVLGSGPSAVAASGEHDAQRLLDAARAADLAYRNHLDRLAGDLVSPDPATRLDAIRVVGQLMDPHGLPLILPFLQGATASTDELIATCIAAGRLGYTTAGPALRSLTSHGDAEVRQAAMNALAQLKIDAPADYTSRANDSDQALRGTALTNLGTLSHAEAGDLLSRGLRLESHSVYRRQCAIGLGRLGDRARGMDLADALSDPDPGVRRYAAEALVKLNYTPAIPYLLRALEANIAGIHLNRCLKLLSGQDFGFDPLASLLERQNAIDRGDAWWATKAKEMGQ